LNPGRLMNKIFRIYNQYEVYYSIFHVAKLQACFQTTTYRNSTTPFMHEPIHTTQSDQWFCGPQLLSISPPPNHRPFCYLQLKRDFYDFVKFKKIHPLFRNLKSTRRRKFRIVAYGVIMPCGLVVVYTEYCHQ
jgi:hypothetical protein